MVSLPFQMLMLYSRMYSDWTHVERFREEERNKMKMMKIGKKKRNNRMMPLCRKELRW